MMRNRWIISGAATIAVTIGASSPASSQDVAGEVTHTVAIGAHYQSFSFGKTGDVEKANLLLLPITFQSALNSRTAVDGYAAYAKGAISGSGKEYTLSGPVDSWVRLRWAVNSWAVVAAGFALPTGVASHTGAEAAVSNTLANDLLGFREAAWGGAASGTFGVSTARRMGSTRVTLGGSYRLAGSFQPSVDTAMRYAPGDEARMRVGIEKEVAGGALGAGLTMQRFTADKADQRNLFQSGNRLRGDISYTAGGWGLYAANLWRAKGDLIIPIINSLDGSKLRDTVVVVGWQNLMVFGASRSMRMGNSLMIVPSGDFKVRKRQDAGGDGWLGTGGIVVPFRVGGAELFPNLKITYGRIFSSVVTTYSQKVTGVELGMVVRRAFVRR